MATKFPPCGCFMHRVFLGLVAPYNDSCPTVCESPSGEILGDSSAFTVDGYYVEDGQSNIVYMESGVITETFPCASGIVDYHIESGTRFYYGYVFISGSGWETRGYIDQTENLDFINFECSLSINGNSSDNIDNKYQISYDGSTWEDILVFSGDTAAPNFAASSPVFVSRVFFTWNGCPYYMEHPDGLCPLIAEDTWQFSVPSYVGDPVVIYPLAIIPAGFTVDIEGTTDGGTTWTAFQVNVDPALLDGTNEFTTGYSVTFITRLKMTSTLGCVYYSKETSIIP